jgi:hypothetical protein
MSVRPILREGQAGRPAQVPTLGTTALAHIGTVEEQDEQHARLAWNATNQLTSRHVMGESRLEEGGPSG